MASNANQERTRAQNIRGQYINKEETTLHKLAQLDSRVKLPGKIFSTISGVCGSLLMGAGMANVMVWDRMNTGLAMGIPGMVIALLAYPLYKLITDHRKKQYAEKIFELSESLISQES